MNLGVLFRTLIYVVLLDRALNASVRWLCEWPERQKQEHFERLIEADAAVRRMRARQFLDKIILKVLPL